MKKGGELSKGIKAELEHKKTIEKIAKEDLTPKQGAKLIAKDHLKESKKYYSELEKMESKFKKGKTIAQTPAPKSERVYGSDVNKKGSSKDSKSAKSIRFSEKTLKSIESIIDEHNKSNPSSKISLDTAKAVVRRGMGAYSVSHRPTITGGKPNSRVAWGLARLNAFIYKVENKKSKSGKYTQDDDLIENISKKYASGGVLSEEEKKETYKKWADLVNMSASELKKFMDSEEGKKAGLSREQANKLGIHYGRQSARWILRMKATPRSSWTPTMWEWAKRQISFNSRMRGNDGALYDEKGNKTRKHLSLLIWGHNPKKYEQGGITGDVFSIKDQEQFKQIITLYNNFSEKFSIDNYFIDDKDNSVVFLRKVKFTPAELKEMSKYISDLSKNKNFDIISDKQPNISNGYFKFFLKDKVKYSQGGLIAPNGKESKLTPEQYKLVRTPAFKEWFGDWEKLANAKMRDSGMDEVTLANLSKDISKVVDENGEPLVMYHTSPKKFNKFKEQGHWFSNIIFKQYGKNIYTCFLNVKKPFEIHPFSGWYLDKNYDGGFYDNLPNNINWVVYDSNQIKLADGSNTTFDANNDDIRFSEGGLMENEPPANFENVLWDELANRYEEGGSIKSNKITCAKCKHSWHSHESEEHDTHVCHKCGHDNKEQIQIVDYKTIKNIDKVDKMENSDIFYNEDIFVSQRDYILGGFNSQELNKIQVIDDGSTLSFTKLESIFRDRLENAIETLKKEITINVLESDSEANIEQDIYDNITNSLQTYLEIKANGISSSDLAYQIKNHSAYITWSNKIKERVDAYKNNLTYSTSDVNINKKSIVTVNEAEDLTYNATFEQMLEQLFNINQENNN